MSDRGDSHPPAPDGYDRQHSPAALLIAFLADHDQSAATGRPLLTEAGVERAQRLLAADRVAGPAPRDWRDVRPAATIGGDGWFQDDGLKTTDLWDR